MKKLGLALAALFLCCGLFAQEITLEDIWVKGTFRSKSIAGIRSMNNGENYCILTSEGIEKYSYADGKKVETIVSFAGLKFKGANEQVFEYEFNSDETKVLLATSPQFIYRRSYLANYYVYDMNTKQITSVCDEKVRLADFSPNGSMVAYVKDNNIYVLSLADMSVRQLTTDGAFNKIIYGTTDWVYEEEFAITKGFFWSPDSKKIAFYSFDESKVKEFTIPYYGELYPMQYTYKYPKAGEDNSVIGVHVYDMETSKTHNIDLGPEKDIYVPRLQWTLNNEVFLHKLNRHQNHYELFLINCNDYKMQKVYDERNECYIEQAENVTFLADKQHFILKSEKNGFMNLYKVGLYTREIDPITSGKYDVDQICYIDPKTEQIYFTAAQSEAYNRELLVVDKKKKIKKLSGKVGTYTADFSANGKYYISSYSDTDTPTVYTINNNSGKVLLTLEDNKDLKETLKKYGKERKEFGKFKTSIGVELDYWIIKPAKMEAGKKYPLLFYVYGGPGSQEVLNSQSRISDYMWFRMLAQKGYVVACVDGRGTGMNGEKFKKCTYMELGKYETEDQIEAAKYFGSLPYIDKERIGIFGWSYGGYMSTLCLTKGADYFKTAIAVAPVTNWRYYDNVYTERFMRTPQENPTGYDENSPINHVDKMKGNYLLIHGTADDNVHYQNSMDLITALIKANKQFEHFAYPNKDHGIYGGNTRFHLYTLMTDFILRKL
ncbi:MAG: DPP IV N-terminal domain-containing protein [Bacteroidales bacterium]|nr:DPP IV N-terminal domain-containing protein [Bacteroidales bacterium]